MRTRKFYLDTCVLVALYDKKEKTPLRPIELTEPTFLRFKSILHNKFILIP